MTNGLLTVSVRDDGTLRLETADGVVTGIGAVDGRKVAVKIYTAEGVRDVALARDSETGRQEGLVRAVLVGARARGLGTDDVQVGFGHGEELRQRGQNRPQLGPPPPGGLREPVDQLVTLVAQFVDRDAREGAAQDRLVELRDVGELWPSESIRRRGRQRRSTAAPRVVSTRSATGPNDATETRS